MAHFSTGRFFDCETRRDRLRGVPERVNNAMRQPMRPGDCSLIWPPNSTSAAHDLSRGFANTYRSRFPWLIRRIGTDLEGAVNDDTISRREFGMAASVAGVGLITSSKSLA